ncbi:ABC transporter ATP-binding protein [soil metagenome]
MSSDLDEDIAIRARGLGKCYQIYEKPSHRLLQGLVGKRRTLYRDFWALNGIDMQVRKGETLGIVGRNGSGKSTLLQLIAGTLTPSTGEVMVRGRVAALLELGSGFNPEFTGRENVYLNASILGLSRREIDARFDRIAAFADIGDFIEQPIRNYSSGMVMRLAFSVVAHVDADIMIIDEALAVGDAFFTQKCMRFLREFKSTGTLLFVSHDAGSVTGLCDRAIWLDHGTLRAEGTPKQVMNEYLEAFIAVREGRDGTAAAPQLTIERAGRRVRDVRADLIDRSMLRNDIGVMSFAPPAGFCDGKASIDEAGLTDADGRLLPTIVGGEAVTLEITALALQAIQSPIIGFYFKDRLGQLLFGDNTNLGTGGESIELEVGERVTARFSFDMPRLQQGEYFITAGIATGSQQEHVIQHWIHEALGLTAQGQGLPVGIIGLPMHSIEIERTA